MNLLEAIPNEWIKASVGKYCDVQLGKMLQSDPASEQDELKRYLRAISIAKHGLDLSHDFSMWIKPQEKERFRLRQGDILVSEGGDAGRTAVFDVDEEFYFQNAINRVRPVGNAKILPEFIYYWFAFLKVAGYVEMVCNVATIAHFTAEKVKAAPLALPPLKTQRRIAQFLDKKTASIDGLIEKKRALLDRLAEKRQALITHAVTKGLDPICPMKDSGVDWLGEIPTHWVVLPVKRAAELQSGHTPDKKIDAYWADCDIPWVSLNDTATLRANDYISETAFNVNELGLANSSARLLRERAVVFTRDATIGESAITTRPMAVSQHIIAWLCNEELVIPEFLLFAIYGMTTELMKLTNGSTIKTIGLSDVKRIRVALPPIKEQHAIISHVFEGKAKINDVSEQIASSIDRLTEYRAAMIAAAVTGNTRGVQ